MRWSYKTVHYDLKKEGLLGGTFLDESEIEQSLNEYGKAGWELVVILETQEGLLAVFKQPIAVMRGAVETEDGGRPLVSLRARPTVERAFDDDLERDEPPRRPSPQPLRPMPPPSAAAEDVEPVEERRIHRPAEERRPQRLVKEGQDDIGSIRIE